MTQFSHASEQRPDRESRANALVALSHTPVEHHLYEAMKTLTGPDKASTQFLTISQLMTLSGVLGYSATRRGISGLVKKLSIERCEYGPSTRRRAGAYIVFSAEEILMRRQTSGLFSYPQAIEECAQRRDFDRAVKLIINGHRLTRRQAEIALCCAVGLTNSKIGQQLYVSEQTVKFHLHRIFLTLGITHRGQLNALLFPDSR